METPTKQKGRPRKMYPEPSSEADIEFVKMYNHYMALKKAQRSYYLRQKEKKTMEAPVGEKPRRGRPPKTSETT